MAEAEALRPPRAADAFGLGIAGVSSVLFAASFGFDFGVGNQLTYLIPATDSGRLAVNLVHRRARSTTQRAR